MKLRVFLTFLFISALGCSKDFPNDYLTTNLALLMSKCQAGSVTGNYSTTVLSSPSLYGYWKMDGNNPGLDSSTNGRNGTPAFVTGSSGVISGSTEGASLFNGTTSAVTGITGFDPSTTTEFSLEAWIKPTDLSPAGTVFAPVFSQDVLAGGTIWLAIDVSSSDTIFTLMGGSGTGSSVIAKLNTWYHVVMTKSGSTVRLYVNGQLKGSRTVTPGSSGGTFSIGNYSALYFPGYIDDVAMYTRTLSLPEVVNHYLLGRGRNMIVSPEISTMATNTSVLLTPLGGIAPYTYSYTTGTLDTTLDLALYTAPSTPGTQTITVKDSGCNTAEVGFTITQQPSSFPDLALWLDAGNITDGSSPTQLTWPDYSGGGNNASLAGVAKPTWIATDINFNSLPSVNFNGANNYLDTNGGLATQFGGNDTPLSYFVVFRNTAAGLSRTLMSIYQLASVQHRPLYIVYPGASYNVGRDDGALPPVASPSGPGADGNTHIAASIFSGTQVILSIDGLPVAGINPGALDELTFPAFMSGVRIGAENPLANYFQGQMAEVLVYKRSVSSTEQKVIECYLARKYNILPAIATNSCQ